MFKYLENLRKKPEPERRKAVIFISVSITLVILIVWGIALGVRVGHTDFSFDVSPDWEMPSLKETFSNFVDQINGLVDNDATYESGTTTETE